MEFAQIFSETLSGKILKLRFVSADEYQAFKNSYAVYHHRQITALRLCGMADEFEFHSLMFKFNDNILSIQYAKKEVRKYNFTVIEEDTGQDDSTEEGKE